MSSNEIDEILDSSLDKIYLHIKDTNIYSKVLKDPNFVRFQSNIIEFVENFNSKNPIKLSKDLLKNQKLIEDTIRMLLYYYFFIGLVYHHKSGRESFITNIIEISKNQNKSKIKVPGFFNSNSNSLIIKSYDIVKNSIELSNQKTIEKIKSTITNAPIKYETTKSFINEISLDFFKDKIVDNPDNFHILIKIIVIKNIYQKIERNNLLSILENEKESDGEFRYITIVTAKVGKMVDYNVIEKMLSPEQIRQGLADDIYNYILDYKEKNKLLLKNRENIVDYLFAKKILIPITEEFIRYHKKTEKYQKGDASTKNDTKAKYIISKLKQVKDYFSKNADKDAKTKLNIKNLFYNPLFDRGAVLVNQAEDVKIINKLKLVDNPELDEVLNEMETLTKYSYINFNNFSKDGFKLRPSVETEAIRALSLNPIRKNKVKKNKVDYVETRMGNDLLDLNIVGVLFIPEKDFANNLPQKDLIEVSEKSPYNDFIKKTEDALLNGKSSDKKYFWLFDTKKDKLDTNLYQDVSGTDIDKTIHVFLENFYDKYYETLLKKTQKMIKENKINTFEKFYYLIDKINNKYADLHREPEIFNDLVSFYKKEVIKDIEITPDFVDNMIPNQNDKLIKLPSVNINQIKKNLITVEKETKKEKDDSIQVKSICIHHIKWQQITAMRKADVDVFNQNIFDFVKQYVKVNENGEYICKSCNELIPVRKYVYSGTYVEELDTFLTTSIAVSQNLERIPKYRAYNRTIKNLDRLVERIGLLANFNILLGNTPVIKLRRKLIVKDVLDMVLAHTDTLSKIMSNKFLVDKRRKLALEKYNINPSLSQIFFFQLKDDIFLTSSEDTDKFKIIKYNNLIVYLILMILLEINSGQILGIKETKFYNFYFFEKFIPIFRKLKLRLSQKEIISLDKIPLFSYAIYIFSGIIVKDNIWFGTPTKGVNVEAQKEIIHSLVDLINSIIEINFKKEKEFIYESISSKILNQIKGTFQDTRVFKMIENEKKDKVIVDKKDKKIRFMEIKHKGILMKINDDEYVFKSEDFNKCYTQLKKLNQMVDLEPHNYLTKELLENALNKQILSQLKKVCSRDKLEKWEKTLCDKYGPDFNKKLDKKDLDIFIQSIKNNQNKKFIKNKLDNELFIKNINKTLDRRKNVINRWDDIFNKNKNLNNYLSIFLKNLKNILGSRIKTETLDLFLDDNIYIIENDYLGNKRKEILQLKESSGNFKIENNNSYFKNPVRYFFDTKSRTYLYFHLITNQYLGYSTDKKKYQKIQPNNYLKIKYSLKDMILNLGIKNHYERILDYFKDIPKKTNKIVKTVLNERINRLKHLCSVANSIVYQIKNKNTNSKDNKIVKEFVNRISNFNTVNSEGRRSVFKNIHHLIDIKSLDFDTEFIFEYPDYVNIDLINKLNNNDQKIIFYLIFELNKLIEYNSNSKIKTELAYLIASIIKYLFENYYQLNYSTDIQKFYFLSKLIDDDSMVDERISFVGMYSELLKQEEDELLKIEEANYDAQEEIDALDVDDMEEGDDFFMDNNYDNEIPDSLE